MAVKVREFAPNYVQDDVDATGYVTLDAYTARNTPPPIKAWIGGEEWYLDPIDLASWAKVAANRFNVTLLDGRTGHTITPGFERIMQGAL